MVSAPVTLDERSVDCVNESENERRGVPLSVRVTLAVRVVFNVAVSNAVTLPCTERVCVASAVCDCVDFVGELSEFVCVTEALLRRVFVEVEVVDTEKERDHVLVKLRCTESVIDRIREYELERVGLSDME